MNVVRFIKTPVFHCVLIFASSVFTSHQTSSQDLAESLKPFLSKHCNDCHADGANEGGLELDLLSTDLSNAGVFAKWERIFDRVRAGEMPPPPDAGHIPQPQIAAFLRLLGMPLLEAHGTRKGTVLRRLNRNEYQNTVNDLFGTQLDLASRLPEDGRSGEFDNIGEALGLSMVHLQQYLDAIEVVLNTAIENKTDKPKPTVRTFSYANTRDGERHIGKLWKKLDDGSVVFFRGGSFPSGVLRDSKTETSGTYKIRVTGYTYQSEKPVTFSIGASGRQENRGPSNLGYFTLPPNQPTTIEVVSHLDTNCMIEIMTWGIWDPDNYLYKNGADTYEGPGLAISQVELEGPLIDEFPGRGHRFIFGGLNRGVLPPKPWEAGKSWYRPSFAIVEEDVDEKIKVELTRIAGAAFRRPATSAEVEDFHRLYLQQVTRDESPEQALKTAIAAIFCSPEFLYLNEPQGFLDDHALASRLSYFLTRTLPDQELLQTAKRQELTVDKDSLLAHTRRLLDSDHADRFIADFTDSWLNLRDLQFTSPDQKLYPEYDLFLQDSMVAQTRNFVSELIRGNHRVGNLAKSDFTMLNNRLAEHYGIAGVEHPELKKVKLPDDSVRGGLLGQASILKVSANGTNTSPVVRGVWVMERLLGQTPPPPPVGIAGVEPDIRGATTLRELLDQHRDMDSCRSCHQVIDPPGFALESFNPIGGWRERFRSLGTGDKVDTLVNSRRVTYRLGRHVDASGELPDGRKFNGFVEFQRLLSDDEEVLAKALTTKLLTFSTGREMGFSDRAMIANIVEKSKASGHGVRDLIELVVMSEAFRRK